MWGACVVRVYIGLRVGLNTSGVLVRFMRLGVFKLTAEKLHQKFNDIYTYIYISLFCPGRVLMVDIF